MPDTKPNLSILNAFLTTKADESAVCAARCVHSIRTGLSSFFSSGASIGKNAFRLVNFLGCQTNGKVQNLGRTPNFGFGK